MTGSGQAERCLGEVLFYGAVLIGQRAVPPEVGRWSPGLLKLTVTDEALIVWFKEQ